MTLATSQRSIDPRAEPEAKLPLNGRDETKTAFLRDMTDLPLTCHEGKGKVKAFLTPEVLCSFINRQRMFSNGPGNVPD